MISLYQHHIWTGELYIKVYTYYITTMVYMWLYTYSPIFCIEFVSKLSRQSVSPSIDHEVCISWTDGRQTVKLTVVTVYWQTRWHFGLWPIVSKIARGQSSDPYWKWEESHFKCTTYIHGICGLRDIAIPRTALVLSVMTWNSFLNFWIDSINIVLQILNICLLINAGIHQM